MPTVAQLRKSLKAQGLDTTGTKSQLEARLAEAPACSEKRKAPGSESGGSDEAAAGKKAKPPGSDDGGAAAVPADIVFKKRREGKSREIQVRLGI